MPLQPFVNQSSTNEAIFVLLTFITPSETIRVVNNNEDVISRGDTFIAYPFTIVLDTDDGESQPEISLTIDNVDLMLMTAIRGILEPPRIKLELVLSSTPDIVEKTIDYLHLDSVQYDALTIQARMRPINILQRKFPVDHYTASRFMDLFYG